jgi:hypothetical protein
MLQVAWSIPHGGTFQLGNAHGDLDPPLADHHRLGLHPSEGLGVAMLGADAGDLVEGVVQPLPLTRDLALSGSQFANGFGHLCCSLHFVGAFMARNSSWSPPASTTAPIRGDMRRRALAGDGRTL